MLKKLLKYDLLWIYKVLIVFYILAIFFALLGRGLAIFDSSLIFKVISEITKGFSIGMIISIFINNFMRSWSRFINNIYKDESYLTHTLPIPKNTIYNSKILATIITIFSSVMVSLVCIFIMYYSRENIEILKSSLELAASIYNSTVIKLVLVISILLFLEILFMIIIGYASIIIGYRSNDNRLVRTIIYGFIMYVITQGLMLFIIYIVALFNKDIMDIFVSNNIENINIIRYIMYIAILIYVIYISIYYIIGKIEFNKGVNIE